MLIIDKCGWDVAKALFYVRKTVENGWSRNVLAVEIAGDLYSRQGKAVTNFSLTLPEPDSDLALNTPQENPAIGLLVCRGKNAPLAKYLLGKIDMPIGVSDYELLRKVPDDFKSKLPTIEEIEAELADMERGDGK